MTHRIPNRLPPDVLAPCQNNFRNSQVRPWPAVSSLPYTAGTRRICQWLMLSKNACPAFSLERYLPEMNWLTLWKFTGAMTQPGSCAIHFAKVPHYCVLVHARFVHSVRVWDHVKSIQAATQGIPMLTVLCCIYVSLASAKYTMGIMTRMIFT